MCLCPKCYVGDQIRVDEMGEASGMYGREEKYIQTTCRPRHRQKIILKLIFKGARKHGLLSSGSGRGQMMGSCKTSTKPLDIIKCGECLA